MPYGQAFLVVELASCMKRFIKLHYILPMSISNFEKPPKDKSGRIIDELLGFAALSSKDEVNDEALRGMIPDLMALLDNEAGLDSPAHYPSTLPEQPLQEPLIHRKRYVR